MLSYSHRCSLDSQVVCWLQMIGANCSIEFQVLESDGGYMGGAKLSLLSLVNEQSRLTCFGTEMDGAQPALALTSTPGAGGEDSGMLVVQVNYY